MARTPSTVAGRAAGACIVALIALLGCERDDGVVVAAPGDWEDARTLRTRQGMELAMEEAAARGAAPELRLEFHSHDRNDLGSVVAIAQRLTQRSDVVAVTGHTGSVTTNAALPIYQGEIPSVLPAATSSSWDVTPPWSFRVTVTAFAYAAAVAELQREMGWTRTVVLFDNSPQARSSARALKDALAGTLFFHPLYTEEAVGPHDPIVESVLRWGPDVIVLVVGERNASVLVPLIRSMDRNVPLVGDRWESLIGAPGLRGTYTAMADFIAPDGRVRDRAFAAQFRDRFGTEPGPYGAYGYDAVSLLVDAVEAVGADRNAIQRWLLARSQDPVPGVTGALSFDSVGLRAGLGVSIWRVCNDDQFRAPGRCP